MENFALDRFRANDPNSSHLEVLSGWKDIGNYLGKGVRTVQRYEREFGLPVRRPTARQRGSVLATKNELDAWVLASSVREPVEKPRQLKARPETRYPEMLAAMERMKTLCDETLRLRKECRLSQENLVRSIRHILPCMPESTFPAIVAKPAVPLQNRVEVGPLDDKMLKTG